jgi:nicotinamidase-related amidase
MPLMERTRTSLLVIDVQARLMPVIADGEGIVRNARRLLDAARLLGVPATFTEQNPDGLGSTISALSPLPAEVVSKMTFNAARAPALASRLPRGHAVVVAGCEAHVCVLQSVLGLLSGGHRVHVVSDAIGSRDPDNKAAGIARMASHGAEVVTTEMVVFEWLETCEHPRFKEALGIIK